MSKPAKLSLAVASVLLLAGAAVLVAIQRGAAPGRAEPLLRAATRAIAHGNVAEAERLALGRKDDPDAVAVLARLAARKGDYDQAAALLEPVQRAHPASEAALELGLLMMLRGRPDEGRRILQPISMAEGGPGDSAAALRAARAAAALGDVRDANALFRQANNALGGDPAINTAWGAFLLEKHQPGEALTSFQAALEADPDWAPALLGAAQASAELGRPGAAAMVEQALKIDPSLVPANVYIAEAALNRDQHEEARKAIERALAVNPREPAAHAVLAAMAHVDGRRADFDAAVAACLAVNPAYGEVYRVVAAQAARSNRYDEAVELAERAVALDPGNLRASADMGMHLMRLGDEARAREILERTFRADPYDLVTKNLLDLLDLLDTFESFPSTNAVLRLDKAEAPVLQHYAQPIVQEALEKFGKRYGFSPTGPILVEIFPKHDHFAVRTFGLPGLLGALGACFGRVVTLNSPRARDPGTYNWQSALWHEMAHVFTLQLSKERVPRWLTEGISVWEEGRVRPEWARDSELTFAQAYTEGRVPSLADLNGAFTRADTINLAYFQSSVIVELLVERFGEPVLRSLLLAYADGLPTDAALEKAAGMSLGDLQASLDEMLERRYGKLGRALQPPEKAEMPEPGDVAALEAFARRYSGSYPAQMAVAQQLVKAGATAPAFAVLERAAELVPQATGADSPHAIMAGLALKAGDTARARAELVALLQHDHTNVEAARQLAALAEKVGDQQARRLAYERLVTIDPFDAAAHTALGRIAQERGENAIALREFQAAVAAGPIDPVSAHCDLGEAFLAAGRTDDAKQQALAALKTAPTFERAQTLLLKTVDK